MSWILVLAVLGFGAFLYYRDTREEKKKQRDFTKRIDLLVLMDNMRGFLRAGTSIDQVYQMMPPNLRHDERRIHDQCAEHERCYCLVCCLYRDAHHDTSIKERMVH